MDSGDCSSNAVENSCLWPRAAKWLLALGPLFFISYGAVNAFTASRNDVGQFVFDWEHHIPFWEWTIVPYMSIDLLYAISLFICTSKEELDRHGLRLLLATLISVVCFLLFPLQFTFTRPETSGVYGYLFDLLNSFDRPYNQAPSLHISLLVLIWYTFNQHVRHSGLRLIMHTWMLLIGLSVLTTWQHHFVDAIGGLVVALLLLYLIPERSLGWHRERHIDSSRKRFALLYSAGCILFSFLATVVVIYFSHWGWLLVWPALATGLVAIAYAGFSTQIFQYKKQKIGTAALLMLTPYLLAARLSALWLSQKRPGCVEVVPGIWLGRVPQYADLQHSKATQVLNVTAEISPLSKPGQSYRRVPMLDLVAPSLSQLQTAVEELDQMTQRNEPVLVHCALGLSRSALVIAAWLLHNGQASNLDEAVSLIKKVRPDCVINKAQLDVLAQIADSDCAMANLDYQAEV